jgi:hypothetical protein
MTFVIRPHDQGDYRPARQRAILNRATEHTRKERTSGSRAAQGFPNDIYGFIYSS